MEMELEWVRGPAIGRGATATVSLATAVPSGDVFAVKSTELRHSTLLQRENYVMSKLDCPHIVKYLGYGIEASSNSSSGKSTYNLCMEYVAGGSLADEIQRVGGRLDEERVRVYTRQILQGLDYLHVNGVAHCDIKSHNILVGDQGAKIADLGCAKLVGELGFATSAFSGTPAFMAPEVARGEKQGYEADIWALGCTIIEMSTGNSPWPELNDPVAALYKIGYSGDVPAIPRWLSEEGRDFVAKCLVLDPKERWTAKELLQHPFLEELDTLLQQVKDSNMKSPSSVLDQSFWDSVDGVELEWESPKNSIPKGNSLDSPANRIKTLLDLQATLSPAPNWTWSEDWITVRSSDSEEIKESSCYDQTYVIVQDDDTFEQELESESESESSILVELDNSRENILDFSSLSTGTDIINVLPFDSLADDSFVSDNLNFETDNNKKFMFFSKSHLSNFSHILRLCLVA